MPEKSLKNKVIIFGGGAWGTAIANLVARNNQEAEVIIIARNEAVIDDINFNHCNYKHNGNIILSPNIRAKQEINDSDLINCEFLFIATPAKEFSKIIAKIAEYKISQSLSIVICAKGVDGYVAKFFSEIASDQLPNNSSIIMAGPNFAGEVAKGKFSTTTISSNNQLSCEKLSKLINGKDFKCEYFNNPINVEICGIFKNIIAIACGICDGMDFGENFKASIVSQGLKEIKSLCKIITNSSDLPIYAGFGDIFLTCSSKTSRNYLLGFEIAKQPLEFSFFSDQAKLRFDKHYEGANSAIRINEIITKINKNIDNNKDQFTIANIVKLIVENKISNQDFKYYFEKIILTNS